MEEEEEEEVATSEFSLPLNPRRTTPLPLTSCSYYCGHKSNVLLRFRLHRVAIIADISRMYCAAELTPSDRDLHRFVWRNKPDETPHPILFSTSSTTFLLLAGVYCTPTAPYVAPFCFLIELAMAYGFDSCRKSTNHYPCSNDFQ